MHCIAGVHCAEIFVKPVCHTEFLISWIYRCVRTSLLNISFIKLPSNQAWTPQFTCKCSLKKEKNALSHALYSKLSLQSKKPREVRLHLSHDRWFIAHTHALALILLSPWKVSWVRLAWPQGGMMACKTPSHSVDLTGFCASNCFWKHDRQSIFYDTTAQRGVWVMSTPH